MIDSIRASVDDGIAIFYGASLSGSIQNKPELFASNDAVFGCTWKGIIRAQARTLNPCKIFVQPARFTSQGAALSTYLFIRCKGAASTEQGAEFGRPRALFTP